MSLKKHLSAVIATITILCVGNSTIAVADEFHGRWVKGRILDTYKHLGGYKTFGNATTDELNAANGGKFQVFERDSSIYWHPGVSNGTARQVGGRIRDKWAEYNWENGHLKYPTTDELPTRVGSGRFNHFEGGSIFWSPQTDAHVVQGEIRDRWELHRRESGTLGFPLTDELRTPNGVGRYNHFQGGSIYWTPQTGPQKVQGRIRDYWAKLGWENSRFGFPVSEEYPVSGGAIQQDFQNQNLQWVPYVPMELGSYDDGWSSYQQLYMLSIQDERWTPQAINREITTHFNQYFTFTGCPDVLYVGAQCGLKTITGQDAPVEVIAIAPDGFSLKSLEGHPEGADRVINFQFRGVRLPAGTFIRLFVQASGPAGGASLAGPFNAETLARYSWIRFSQNIISRIKNSSTTYITSDKTTPGARVRRSLPAEDTDIIGKDIEIIDPADVDTSMITDLVPVYPLGLDDATLEQLIKSGEVDVADASLEEE